MLSLFCDKSHQASLQFAEMVFHHLKSLQVFTTIEDFNEEISFSSFSVLIFSESIIPLKLWGNYGVIQELSSINSSTLSSYFKCSPKFILNFSEISSNPDYFIQILKPFIPKIPGYKQFTILKNSAISSRLSRPNKFKLISVSSIISQEDYLVKSIEFEALEPYEAGVNLSLYPENSDLLVEELMGLQEYQDWTLSIQGSSECTEARSLKQMLKARCDLTGLIRKPVLKTLSQYSRDSESLDTLNLLTSMKGKEKFINEIQEKCLTVVDLLKIFNISVPPADLIQILDSLKPRFYSVSSAFPMNLQVAVQILKKRTYIGCFSEFTLNAVPGMQVFGEPKKSVFQLVFDQPLILIANGCGVAPFRGILLEVNRNPERFPKVLIVAGFRTPDHFVYKEDFEHLFSENPKIVPLICFSRTGDKKYIQAVLSENSSLVLELITGFTFICGGNQMGKSVTDLLKSLTEASSLLWEDVKSRIKLETWG